MIVVYVHQVILGLTARKRHVESNAIEGPVMALMDNVTVNLDMVALTAASSLSDAPTSAIGVESALKQLSNQNTVCAIKVTLVLLVK